MRLDATALVKVRDYLDEMMYAMLDLRMSLELGPSMTGFPAFEPLRKVVARLGFEHAVLFRLFRLGETVEDQDLRAAVPDGIVTALLDAELLVRDGNGGWRTPSLLLVPAEGLIVISSIPPSYPTRTGPTHTWFDLSTAVVARTIPRSLAGQRALDICSGTGIQALLCAERGAVQAVGVELSAPAVTIARANAVLNGLAERTEFRESDGLAALDPDEQFDHVLCNTPYAPVVRDEEPATLGDIGNSVVWPVLDALPKHLSPIAGGLIATWRSVGSGGDTEQRASITARLGEAGCSSSAYLDPAFDTVEGVQRILRNDLAERSHLSAERSEAIQRRVAELLSDPGSPVDGFYNQLIHFRKDGGSTTKTFRVSAPAQQG
ncbi:methyltransferase [Saccharopolyspora taberi]